MPISLTSRIRRSADQVSTELNGEVAILSLKSSQYYGLNVVGALVWETLNEPRQVMELCQAVIDRFDVDKARCEADVLTLVASLDRAGLVENVGP